MIIHPYKMQEINYRLNPISYFIGGEVNSKYANHKLTYSIDCYLGDYLGVRIECENYSFYLTFAYKQDFILDTYPYSFKGFKNKSSILLIKHLYSNVSNVVFKKVMKQFLRLKLKYV